MDAPRFTGVLLGSLVLLGGCGNDFEALFQNSSQSPDGGRPTSNADGGTGGQGGGPGGSGACDPQPASACQRAPSCDDGTCEYSCSTCGCTCPRVDCSGGSGGKDGNGCEGRCERGTSCDVACNAGKCDLDCRGCTAAFTCGAAAASCNVKCRESGSCDVLCDNAGDCSVECPVGSACLLSCGANPTSCKLSCPGGALQQCTKGWACNRPCKN